MYMYFNVMLLFSQITKHYDDLKDGGKTTEEINVETCSGGLAQRNLFISFSIYMLSAIMSLLTLPPALVVLTRHKPTRNRLNPALWRATQINSWSLLSIFIANYFISFRQYHAYLAGIPQEAIPCLQPYATVGNYFAIVLGCLFILELPFVMRSFVWQELQARTTPMRNKCSFRLKMLARSFGLTGIVFFLQIIGGYSVFFILLLLASPLLAMYSLITQGNIMVLLTSITALLIYPFMARNAGRRGFHRCGLLLYISFGAAASLGFAGIFVSNVADNLNDPFNSNQITTSIISSCLLALMAYIAKQILWHRLWQPHNAEREFEDEETPLLHNSQDNVE